MAGLIKPGSLNKAKDSLSVGLQVGKAWLSNDDMVDLGVAVTKATNTDEVTPKEKHMQTILAACQRSRQETGYVLQCLQKRLREQDWLTVVKSLMVLHRLLREGPPRFAEDLAAFQRERGPVHNLVSYKDERTQDAWDFSGWARTYSLYLEERGALLPNPPKQNTDPFLPVECHRVTGMDLERIEQEKLRHKMRDLEMDDLLSCLPMLQTLQQRAVGCKPEGAATHNRVILQALLLVLKETRKLNVAIFEGMMNMVDLFFHMERVDAVKGLEAYKLANKQTNDLLDLYEMCRLLDVVGMETFPAIAPLPKDFQASMQAYVNDAPRAMGTPGGPSPSPPPAPPARPPAPTPPKPPPAPAARPPPPGSSTVPAGWENPAGPPPAGAGGAGGAAAKTYGRQGSFNLMGFDESFGAALPAPSSSSSGAGLPPVPQGVAGGFDDEDDNPWGDSNLITMGGGGMGCAAGGAAGGGAADGGAGGGGFSSGGDAGFNKDALASLYAQEDRRRHVAPATYAPPASASGHGFGAPPPGAYGGGVQMGGGGGVAGGGGLGPGGMMMGGGGPGGMHPGGMGGQQQGYSPQQQHGAYGTPSPPPQQMQQQMAAAQQSITNPFAVFSPNNGHGPQDTSPPMKGGGAGQAAAGNPFLM